MARNFTTITDVTDALYDAEPGFRDELTEDRVREIVRAHIAGGYRDITEDEFIAMIVAAYSACGADAETARWLAYR